MQQPAGKGLPCSMTRTQRMGPVPIAAAACMARTLCIRALPCSWPAWQASCSTALTLQAFQLHVYSCIQQCKLQHLLSPLTCGHPHEAVEHSSCVRQSRKAEGSDPQVLGGVCNEPPSPVPASHDHHEMLIALWAQRQGSKGVPLVQGMSTDSAEQAIGNATSELEDLIQVTNHQ